MGHDIRERKEKNRIRLHANRFAEHAVVQCLRREASAGPPFFIIFVIRLCFCRSGACAFLLRDGGGEHIPRGKFEGGGKILCQGMECKAEGVFLRKMGTLYALCILSVLENSAYVTNGNRICFIFALSRFQNCYAVFPYYFKKTFFICNFAVWFIVPSLGKDFPILGKSKMPEQEAFG